MSCCQDLQTNKPMLGYEQALELMLQAAKPLTETESLPIEQALGRVLAKPVVSSFNVPLWDNSAMDGYAVISEDLADGRTRLPISQRIPAGQVGRPLQAGTAARIFTGAPIPRNADAVVIQELCERDGDQVVIKARPAPGSNIRRAGEDLTSGSEIIDTGTKLAPQHLGLTASVGIDRVVVYRRLRVALLASGNELAMPGQPLDEGQIYNSNQFSATGILQALGCEVIPLGIVDDTLDATCTALIEGAAKADLVVASGGVSVGEEDHVKPAVERLGSLEMWKIAIRPGKPVAFGHIGDTPFIGAPGNPVSLFITLLLFARAFILKMQGRRKWARLPFTAQAAFDWPRPDKRREFARARMEIGDNGKLLVSTFPSRSSGVLSSVVWANGLVMIEENRTIKQGDPVEFFSFDELMS